ncbi:AcrB/AcrD/AcrF family protein [Desulfonema ishimotonii]|uniref:AcrB/AcrD/AcrF family protein n=1 Tax=Desulfonema ishimotonii TaxID=45657 RepID=A0A401G1D8_9BACT|nr:efflux RND transporter permease subunit [Desulfonema ishimotonii]GBC63032.1 AcrB/AcrD/AcrF family protein [Desulfonema ishimotonii]
MTEKNTQGGAIAWMAGNSVAANLLMLVLLVGGLFCGTRIRQEVFPEFEMDFVTISVSYPGASPEEVEQGIILAVEEAVRGLDGVSEVTSSANEGRGSVTVEALLGADLQKLANDIQSEVDRVTSFPEDAEEPQVEIASRRRGVISVVIYGDPGERVLREVAETARDNMLRSPDVTQAELSAVRDFEISIEVPQEKLRAHNLTLGEVAERVGAASVELPGGGLKTPSGEVLVRMKERRDYGREFARIPVITRNDGTEVVLDDIATIIDGFEDTDNFATYNGQQAVMIDVYRVGGQTPVDVADAVKAHVARLRESLPPGIGVDTLNDRSEHYRQRMNLLVRNGYLGLMLVFIALGLFLEARLAFWVSMGIPISFLGAMLFLPLMDVSLNMISMFAFIIALGIVVDDAIVVGENIHTWRQEGHSFAEAAVMGAREVAMPVTFSILTNVVAFLPLWFVPGTMGKIFKFIPLVVVTVFLISLIESLFVLPAHLGHQRDRVPRGLTGWFHRQQQRFSNGFSRMVRRVYTPLLDMSLRNRYLVLSVSVALLMCVLAIVISGRMGMTLFPRIESDYAQSIAVLPYGSAVEKTGAVQKTLVNAAKEIAAKNGGDQLVRGIFAQVGASSGATSGSHVAKVRVYLTPPEERPLSTAEFTRHWRKSVGELSGPESLSFKSNAGGPGSGAALTIELSHRDLGVLEAASADLADALGYFPKVRDIDDGFSPGKQQIDYKIRPEGRALGLTARAVARQVRHAFYGAEVVRQQRGRNEVRVMVRLPEAERISEYNLEELIIRTPSGVEVPLRQVVDVSRGRAYTEISRRDGRRVVTVTADVEPPGAASQVLEAVKSETLPDLVRRYAGLSFGFEGKQADMRESMQTLFTGLLGAMLTIYALLAIPFRSYSQPAIVMTSIPFGIVGAVLGHMLMGYSLSIMSMFGVVALSGVVVNDSLVLIDFANRQRQAGKSAHDAVLAAGLQRFRPILLTTLTTFGGLAPMIFETSRQARYLIPMALSLGFGVVFATLITLILVPALYMILEDLHRMIRWLWPDMEKEGVRRPD